MSIQYHHGKGRDKNWIVSESAFHPDQQGKCESIMALGNGYLGLRSSLEESYPGQTRGLYVAGTYDRAGEPRVSELPNAADIVSLELTLGGEGFSLMSGQTLHYRRDLNLRTAELLRRVHWRSPGGKEYRLLFRRFVSLRNPHLIGMRIEITPLVGEAVIEMRSGIHGRSSNSGARHFLDGEQGMVDEHILWLQQQTGGSGIDFLIHTGYRLFLAEQPLDLPLSIARSPSAITAGFSLPVPGGRTLGIEKLTTLHTSRDGDHGRAGPDPGKLPEQGLKDLKAALEAGYERSFAEHRREWARRWQGMQVTIQGSDFDQLALRFAQYHLISMTPVHDRRLSVGGKGLSGEGYKGHVFWDTEIYILPFFIYTFPQTARRLLEYRYLTLAGARRKAKAMGYAGAMFAWESAASGDEETPCWGADPLTGQRLRIWCGELEQHISADIAYAVWQYYSLTADQEFMDQGGYELLFETASFWTSRLEWNRAGWRYEIKGVMGPDEYRVGVNNNAFTNYLAHWNIRQAILGYQEARKRSPGTLSSLDERIGVDKSYRQWQQKVDKIYLPPPRLTDGVIPQDDDFFSQGTIDLEPYRHGKKAGSIFHDYSYAQINETQVLKQADVLALMVLLEGEFSTPVKRANWDYYEPKTLHDSSLSLSTHTLLACALEETDLAYELFGRACRIDLGPALDSSNDGIHAASLGGIWQAVVCGFGGLAVRDGLLSISPGLPRTWSKLAFSLWWRGRRLEVQIGKRGLRIRRRSGSGGSIPIIVWGQRRVLEQELTAELSD